MITVHRLVGWLITPKLDFELKDKEERQRNEGEKANKVNSQTDQQSSQSVHPINPHQFVLER